MEQIIGIFEKYGMRFPEEAGHYEEGRTASGPAPSASVRTNPPGRRPGRPRGSLPTPRPRRG